MMSVVILMSLYALTLGCKKYKKFTLIRYRIIGLLTLIAALLIDELILGEVGEKLLTVLGAVIITLAHCKNYQLCQQSKKYPCRE
jgi:hypothetical protein